MVRDCDFSRFTLLLAAIGIWSIRPDRSLAMRWLTPAVSAPSSPRARARAGGRHGTKPKDSAPAKEL